MEAAQTELIDVACLRIGHYVFIDLGWMSHPFPLNSFKIRSREQLSIIRSLGLERIRYSPQRSDPEACADKAPLPARAEDPPLAGGEPPKPPPARDGAVAEDRARLRHCERLFADASRAYRRVAETAYADPASAHETARSLIAGITRKLDEQPETCIRLLSENVGESAGLHAVNVCVVSLLLARARGMDAAAMLDVGVGALLHDIGKIALPDRLRYQNESLSPAEEQLYRRHVAFGVDIGRTMSLPAGALLAIAQHHEAADGSGYPRHTPNERLSPAARIVALVDRYDNLCNPGNPAQALTPYEAMSQLFALRKHCFDRETLDSFVRMMGVYPPGSVVQLSDGRFALVVSVNASRPLKPSIVIHDASVPREEAAVVDLGRAPALAIRRSLRPLQLPRAAFDYLSPRRRFCYFFEHGRRSGENGEAP